MSKDYDLMVDDILSRQDDTVSKLEAKDQWDRQRKYPALTTLSKIYKWAAWFMGVVTVIALVLVLLNMLRGQFWEGLKVFVYVAIIGAFTILFSLAFSEGIKLFTRIENNTKEQVRLLNQLVEQKKEK